MAILDYSYGSFPNGGCCICISALFCRGIAFCADVRHAHDLASVFNHHGISALAVDGGMSKEVREPRVGQRSTIVGDQSWA